MSSKEKNEAEFKRICKNIMATYQQEIDNYIRSKPDGYLTEADVIIMNMNIIMSVSTNMYFTIKELLPIVNIDFDYMKASIINNLKDSFEKVKDYMPQNKYLPLTVDQIKEIQDKGFAMVEMP